MSEFFDEAKKLAGKDPGLANKGLDEAAKIAEDKTGGHFDSQIQAGEQQAEGYLGTDNQGSQDPNQGSQDPNQGSQDPNQGSQDPNQGSQDPNRY